MVQLLFIIVTVVVICGQQTSIRAAPIEDVKDQKSALTSQQATEDVVSPAKELIEEKEEGNDLKIVNLDLLSGNTDKLKSDLDRRRKRHPETAQQSREVRNSLKKRIKRNIGGEELSPEEMEQLAYVVEQLQDLNEGSPAETSEPYVLVPIWPSAVQDSPHFVDLLEPEETDGFYRDRKSGLSDQQPLYVPEPISYNEDEQAREYQDVMEALDEIELEERVAELARFLNDRYYRRK